MLPERRAGKYLPFILIFSFITVLLIGCAFGEQKEPEGEQTDSMTIGICFDTFVVERWMRDRDVFSYTASELGAKVDVQNANGDLETQKEQIKRFIKEKVDAIVIVPIDGNAITDLVVKAKKKGIKVIAYDRQIENANADLYISFDNEAVGRLMGETIRDKAGEQAKVLMICGPTSDSNVESVEAGFQEIVEESGLEVADRVYIEGWKAENVSCYLNKDDSVLDEVDAIMCGNDNLAGEVVRVLSERQMAGRIAVVGQDADLEACQRIVEGTQLMTVYKSVETMARQAAEQTVDLIQGKEPNTGTCFDGTYQVPYIALEPQAVTKENMDEVIISSGFHLKEEVYMNVPGGNRLP